MSKDDPTGEIEKALQRAKAEAQQKADAPQGEMMRCPSCRCFILRGKICPICLQEVR